MLSITKDPYSMERWSNARVEFDLTDIDAAEDATPIATSAAAISNISQTHDRVTEMSNKLATLEPDYFLLDGTFILPDESDNDEVGWWSSEMSDADGNFATDQVLQFDFTEDQSSVGFTVVFDDKADEYAKEFTIQVYDSSDTLLDEEDITENTLNTYISEMSVEDYRKVIITFTKTINSYRRIRVCEVSFGIVRIFTAENLQSVNVTGEIDPVAASLPSSELTFVIDNSDGVYNIINPDSVYSYLQEGQKIDVKIGIGEEENNIELIKMGRFYYTTSESSSNSLTADITANDLFYTLTDTTCGIGETGTWTVDEAVAAVILDSGLDITTNIPTAIGSRTINKCIPSDSSHLEALRLIAQAAMSTCYFNRDDELEFIEFEEGTVVDTLDEDNMYESPTVSDLGRINKVELTVNDEYADTEVVYTSTNMKSSESEKLESISNALVYDGQNVADWLLSIYQQRIEYEIEERGNPARELGDTVQIYDAYDENKNAVITKQEFIYGGTLEANIEARGGF
jgi:hypothetical protein